MVDFSDFFRDNLHQVLQKLVNRDMRIKLFPSNFWVIDPSLEEVCNGMKLKKIAKFLSPTVLKYCPQCYPFNVRAKVFTHELDLLKVENQHGFHHSGNQI
jgi:hypothetical protein